jgi:serine/tyrosine/threonine adenylyltransferase
VKALDDLTFDNRFARLGDAFLNPRICPSLIDEPRLVVASQLGPWPCWTSTRRWPTRRCSPSCSAATRCGPRPSRGRWCIPGISSAAYSPQLGDGRGLLLGEAYNAAGEHWDLHLKGAGQ